MATAYELILMLDSRLGEEQRDALAGDARSRLEAKGELAGESNWGMRKMAFEIEQRGEADYRCYRFVGGNDLLDDLNHALPIADGVLRYRIFKVDPESPMIVPPDTEQIMRRDEDDDRGRGRGRRDDRGPRRGRGEGGREGGREGREGGREGREAVAPSSDAPQTSETPDASETPDTPETPDAPDAGEPASAAGES